MASSRILRVRPAPIVRYRATRALRNFGYDCSQRARASDRRKLSPFESSPRQRLSSSSCAPASLSIFNQASIQTDSCKNLGSDSTNPFSMTTAEAAEPVDKPDAPRPIRHGVFGMTRMTRVPIGSAPSRREIGIPAAMETTIGAVFVCVLSESESGFNASLITCGFTARMTIVAFLTASVGESNRFTPAPIFVANAVREASIGSYPLICSGFSSSRTKPAASAVAICPVPINAILCSDQFMRVLQ